VSGWHLGLSLIAHSLLIFLWLLVVVQAVALAVAAVLVGIERQTVLVAVGLLLNHPWHYFRQQVTQLQLALVARVLQIAVVEAGAIPYFLPLLLLAVVAVGSGVEQKQDYLVVLAAAEQALTARQEMEQPIKVFLVAQVHLEKEAQAVAVLELLGLQTAVMLAALAALVFRLPLQAQALVELVVVAAAGLLAPHQITGALHQMAAVLVQQARVLVLLELSTPAAVVAAAALVD